MKLLKKINILWGLLAVVLLSVIFYPTPARAELSNFNYSATATNCTLLLLNADEEEVEPGESVLIPNTIYTLEATANTGHTLDILTINGEPFTNGSTLACVGNITVSAVAIPTMYNLNRTAENATVYYVFGETTITASEDNVIQYDESFILNVVANEGYTITSILVNGVEIENGATITCVNEINIVATATLNTYNLTTTGDNATINLVSGETTISAGENVLTYGQTATLNVLAEEGYQIDSILVNGVETANGATITFTENLTIEVVSSLIPTQTFDAIPEGMIFTFDNSTMTATVSGYTGTATDLVIPSTVSATSIQETICTLNSIDDFFENDTLLMEKLSPEDYILLSDSVFGETIVYPYEVICNIYTVVMGDDYSVATIGSNVFWWCTCTSIIVPNSVEIIGRDAFQCSSITSLILSSNIQSIGKAAFGNCLSLTDIYFFGSIEDWQLITNNLLVVNLSITTIHYNYVA